MALRVADGFYDVMMISIVCLVLLSARFFYYGRTACQRRGWAVVWCILIDSVWNSALVLLQVWLLLFLLYQSFLMTIGVLLAASGPSITLECFDFTYFLLHNVNDMRVTL